ncbi:MAG: hypothetical protein H0Z31_13995 [Bacillus sp. (in: Bacteria)]|jgi:hypothetical protein|nr:hypothetical protein [Bacillus sp. (in: firmicutes)]
MHHGAGMQVGDVFFQFMIFILGLGMFIVPIVLIIYVIIDYQKRLKRIKVDQLMDELRKQR